MTTENKISATIIALNASKSIGKTISSLFPVTNDIVVIIDSRTTDNTEEVSKKFGVRTFFKDFKDFSDQKNFATEKTKHDWVISLDADEWLSDQLQNELANHHFSDKITSYRIPRKNIIFGKIINHTNWDPNGLIRIFNKKHCRWQGQVHEEIVTKGLISKLKSSIFHENYKTVDEFLTRQNLYSTIRAQELYQSGYRFSLFKALFQPKVEFFRRYIWHAGFLDGLHGLYLSFLMSIYHFSVWIKLWHLSK